MIKKFSARQARRLLPKRKPSDNKASGGRALLVAGSRGMFGAAVLAATASARIGAGYVILLTDKNFPSHRHPDFLTADVQRKTIASLKFNACGVGPGLGVTPRSWRLVLQLLRSASPNVVLDADALSLLAKHPSCSLPTTWVLTPHEGELARLLNTQASQVRKERIKYVRMAQKKYGCVVLLKGHRTLIADGKNIYEIQSGNAALAKAGTGDVLTGLITGLRAQGLDATAAACLAAFVHGFIADRWVKDSKDPLSLMASDLVEELPTALARLRKSR